jgi:hypothetical protein
MYEKKTYPPTAPEETRVAVERIHAEHRAAAAAPRPDALLANPSWALTDAGVISPQSLFDALKSGDAERLTRAARHRNRRRHPLQAP